jgi:hypothetical protein
MKSVGTAVEDVAKVLSTIKGHLDESGKNFGSEMGFAAQRLLEAANRIDQSIAANLEKLGEPVAHIESVLKSNAQSLTSVGGQITQTVEAGLQAAVTALMEATKRAGGEAEMSLRQRMGVLSPAVSEVAGPGGLCRRTDTPQSGRRHIWRGSCTRRWRQWSRLRHGGSGGVSCGDGCRRPGGPGSIRRFRGLAGLLTGRTPRFRDSMSWARDSSTLATPSSSPARRFNRQRARLKPIEASLRTIEASLAQIRSAVDAHAAVDASARKALDHLGQLAQPSASTFASQERRLGELDGALERTVPGVRDGVIQRRQRGVADQLLQVDGVKLAEGRMAPAGNERVGGHGRSRCDDVPKEHAKHGFQHRTGGCDTVAAT